VTRFRFKIQEGDDETVTEWKPETVLHGPTASTVVEMLKLRRTHPDAAISIERTNDDREGQPST
jgi:hypothetical protein